MLSRGLITFQNVLKRFFLFFSGKCLIGGPADGARCQVNRVQVAPLLFRLKALHLTPATRPGSLRVIATRGLSLWPDILSFFWTACLLLEAEVGGGGGVALEWRG